MFDLLEVGVMKTQLATDRLSIAIMTLDDADLLYALDQNPDVMKYINGGKPTSKSDIEHISIPRLASYLTPSKGWGFWKVFEKRELDTVDRRDNFVGWILIRPMGFFSETPEFNNLEIGWRFKQSAWGKGYATESAKAVIKLLVEEQPIIERFTAIADKDNLGSIKIMKKIGMEFICQQFHSDVNGKTEVVIYSLKVNH